MESYYVWVVVLLIISLTLKYGPSLKSKKKTNGHPVSTTEKESLIGSDPNDKPPNDNIDPTKLSEFKQFQKWYITIFLLVMLADWMQGPYVYKLYAQYNFNAKEIAILFVIGFGTSGIVGTFIGSLADKFGRKNMCISFCVMYMLCCGTKHYHSYNLLMIGRFLGGISTSILFSCFESWMVTHHHNKGYPCDKLGSTFQIAWSLNAFIAILAGVITSYGVQFYKEYNIISPPYEVAAFDCSAITLCIALIMINIVWKEENYGDININIYKSLTNSFDLFRNDSRVIFVGIIQSGFESAMYLFVFMWTMALESTNNNNIDHGIIFAVFMEACLVGTTLSSILNWKSEKTAFIACLIGSGALLYVPFTINYEIRLFMFIIFECMVGAYFPTIGALRSKYVPDTVRATVMNIFRIPLNIIVVFVLWYIDELGMKNIFIFSSVLLLIASIASFSLFTRDPPKK